MYFLLYKNTENSFPLIFFVAKKVLVHIVASNSISLLDGNISKLNQNAKQ